ncbi:head protein/prohead protease [Escherichia coli DEC6B]|nr:head protein/prohead protease [Escherichia coli DEC6B]
MLCKDVPIARTGSQVYLPEEIDLEPDASGTVTVWRTEDEVFSPETMASFEGVAVTLGHPEDAGGGILFVNPTNYSELAHGHIQNVRRGTGDKADLLIADVLVKRLEAIDAIEAGLTDVSCGYDALYKQLSPGKGKQHQITGNHLAVGIDRGRAGSRCAIGDSAPSTKGSNMKQQNWFQKLANAIRTKDEDALAKLADEAPDMPSDGMSSIPGLTINMNVPSQATALPADQKTTTDEETDLDKKTGDEDAEEDAKVTGDAAYKRNLIGDAEIICPGFQPSGDKGLKRQVLNHAMRTGDSTYLKSFGIQDYDKVPKAKVDAVFSGALELNKAKNRITPPSGKPTGDRARGPMSPAELNKINADFWKRNQ